MAEQDAAHSPHDDGAVISPPRASAPSANRKQTISRSQVRRHQRVCDRPLTCCPRWRGAHRVKLCRGLVSSRSSRYPGRVLRACAETRCVAHTRRSRGEPLPSRCVDFDVRLTDAMPAHPGLSCMAIQRGGVPQPLRMSSSRIGSWVQGRDRRSACCTMPVQTI